MIRLECDNCEKHFEVDDDQRGMKVACPYCGDINRVDGAVAANGDGKTNGGFAKPGLKKKEGTAANEPEKTVMVVRSAMFRAHPLWYSLMVLCVAGGVVLIVFAKSSAVQPWLFWAGLASLCVGTLWWLGWWGAPHRWVKLTITNKRTIQQEGIVMRRTSEVLHDHIRNVRIEQTVAQRMLRVGSFYLDSSGGSENDPIEIHMKNVADPYGIRDLIDTYRTM